MSIGTKCYFFPNFKKRVFREARESHGHRDKVLFFFNFKNENFRCTEKGRGGKHREVGIERGGGGVGEGECVCVLTKAKRGVGEEGEGLLHVRECVWHVCVHVCRPRQHCPRYPV